MAKISLRSLIGIAVASVVLAAIFVPFEEVSAGLGIGGAGAEQQSPTKSITVLGSKAMNDDDKRVVEVVKEKSHHSGDDKHDKDPNERNYVLTATGVATDKPVSSDGDSGYYSALPADLSLKLEEI